MPLRSRLSLIAVVMLAVTSPLSFLLFSAIDEVIGAEKIAPTGLGDLVAISVVTGRDGNSEFEIVGRDAAQQLLVTGKYSQGPLRDLSRKVNYSATPSDIVDVSSSGYVTPVSEGTATIHVRSPEGFDAQVVVTISHLKKDLPINFPNQIVPIFTKLGCNGGGCHGKSGGQNGFSLSLFGFEAPEDYEHLVKESRGRRLFPAAPDRSLLLLKATGIQPHSGGARLKLDSPSYRVIHRWIEQGMPYGKATDRTVTRIEVAPFEPIMDLKAEQQLTVTAHFSDGSTQDVTRMSQFESYDAELAEVTEQGLVETNGVPGTVAVMVRYLSHVDVYRATVPLGAPVSDLPEPNNYIDELVFKKLQELGLQPSELSDDSAFLRRVTIDITGRIPTGEETEKFLSDTDPTKRDKWIDQLIDSPDYADYFAKKWSALLRNRRKKDTSKRTTYAFHSWIRESLQANKPFDQFVREVVTASGEAGRSPTVAWYHEVKGETALAEDTAQLFLGMRMQCAKCHHHPFEKWSQEDYYALSAFFSRVGEKRSLNEPGKASIFHKAGIASSKNPRSGEMVRPAGLGGKTMEIAADDDPRIQLADWLVDQKNPFFARALVNRYWKHFYGRGLVEPEDDMRVTNPASNPELLDTLANRFRESGYDLKELVRTICKSKTYQLSSTPNKFNKTDKQNYSRFYPRRLNAEVLLDAVDGLTESTPHFAGSRRGVRSVQLPDFQFDSYFLTVFGRPEGNSACDCERTIDATLAQALHLLNSAEVLEKVGGKRTTRLATSSGKHEPRIRELYRAAYSREPTADEQAAAVEYIMSKEGDARGAYEDLLWVLLNTKEFLFNR